MWLFFILEMAILAIFHEQNGYFDKFQSGHPGADSVPSKVNPVSFKIGSKNR